MQVKNKLLVLVLGMERKVKGRAAHVCYCNVELNTMIRWHLEHFIFFLLFATCFSYPLCTDSRAPIKVGKGRALKFCSESESGFSCCDSAQDLHLRQRFQAFNVSHTPCASILKSILCSGCNQFSAQLFQFNSCLREVPLLCNSLETQKPIHFNTTAASIDCFCKQVWDVCGNISIFNSPFVAATARASNTTSIHTGSKITDEWRSWKYFCEAFGGASEQAGVCFNGESVSFKKGQVPPPQHPQGRGQVQVQVQVQVQGEGRGLCLEKIENGAYLNLIPHPDGSNRVFLSTQQGKIWLANVPDVGSKSSNDILVESEPFLDITDQVLFDTEFGLMGMAFHPNFVSNGRFFLSFNCDKMKHQGCFGRCSCNTDVTCDPSMISADNGIHPCQYHTVIAEFTVNGTAPKPSMAKRAKPLEVRRIFTMGLAYRGGAHAGQLLFGPADGYLYLTMGDGSDKDDPYNFAQNKKSLLGKILRIDIDNVPSEKEINELGLWGNYSIPRDNPYVQDKQGEGLGEIWAIGFRNPWRCSFDSQRPSYFLCGDAGQDEYEEVDIVRKGGNYGWRVYEGPHLFHPQLSPACKNPIFPVMGYSHSDINNIGSAASIIGGYVYRSMVDPCMYGRYIYMDLYGQGMWAGSEYPLNSGNFTSSRIGFRCAHDSPIPCSHSLGIGFIFSFGQDNRKDVYILTSKGVHRVTTPSRCNLTCSKQIILPNPNAVSTSSTSPTSLPFVAGFLAFFLLQL